MKIPETDVSFPVMDSVSHMLASAIAALDFVIDNDAAWTGFCAAAEKATPGDEWGEPERWVMRADRDALTRMYLKLDHMLGHPPRHGDKS